MEEESAFCGIIVLLCCAFTPWQVRKDEERRDYGEMVKAHPCNLMSVATVDNKLLLHFCCLMVASTYKSSRNLPTVFSAEAHMSGRQNTYLQAVFYLEIWVFEFSIRRQEKHHKELGHLLHNTLGLQSETQNAACKPWISEAVALVNNFPVNTLYKACPLLISHCEQRRVQVSQLNNECLRLALIAGTKLLIVTWEFSPIMSSLKEKGLFVLETRVSWEVSTGNIQCETPKGQQLLPTGSCDFQKAWVMFDIFSVFHGWSTNLDIYIEFQAHVILILVSFHGPGYGNGAFTLVCE